MNKMKRPLTFLSAVLLLGIAVHMRNERAVPGPSSRSDGGRSAHAEPCKQERPEPGPAASDPRRSSERTRLAGNTGLAAGALPPSLAADRVFPALDPDVLALQLPADPFRIYQKICVDFPDVDWTDIDASHRAFMNKRDEYPLNLSDEQREEYAAWLGEAEPVSRALIRLRAEAHGLSANGMENGRGYYIDGFREGVPVYMVTSNVGAATTTGASLLRWNPGFDPALGATVSGSEIYVNINDHGTIYENPEFQLPNAGGSRILLKEVNDSGDRSHMTHVAGTVAAWGYNSSVQGMAPRAWIRSFISHSASDITGYGMATPGQQTGETNPRTGNPQLKSVVGNTSLGTTSPYNLYDSTSATYDTALRDHPYYMHFASSGNSGGGYETLTGGFKMAKNMIGIGSVSEASRNSAGVYTGGGSIASSSSRGPTYDGRINPDFVAKGESVYSVSSEIGAQFMSGTSMASPNAAGSVALLMDYVRQRLPQQYLRSSTYRALLATTADDRGNPGPDYTYGWGILNIHAAAKIIRQQAENPPQRLIIEDTLSPSQTWTENYYCDGTKPIRVTISWLDPASTNVYSYNRLTRLVNDLDLRLIDPSGTERKPYVMPFTTGQGETPAYSTSLYNANAVQGDNFTDPVEQVFLASSMPGTYTVRITHKGTLKSNQAQPFSVAVSGLTTASGLAPTIDVAFTEAIPQNGLLSPGEEAVAAVSVVNYSRDTANNVVGKITTTDPDVILLNDTVSYGTLTTGQISGGDGSFRIRLPQGVSPREIEFTLTITTTSPAGPWAHPAPCAYVSESAINGYVRDGHGNPVAGATVSWTGISTGQTTSDANGFYVIAEVDGSYNLTVSAPGYVSRAPVSLTVPPYVSQDLILDYYDLEVSPGTFSMQAFIGQTVSTSMTLANTGTLPVTWSIPTSEYRFTTSDQSGGPTYVWNDISSTGTRVTGASDDTTHGPYNLGFSMPFYGQNFTSIRICSNGWLSFTSTETGYATYDLPNFSIPENLIAPVMRDLSLVTEGTIHYKQVDHSTFVVQFTNVPKWGSSTKKVTFQVVLKRDGTILFYYQRTDDATVGLVGIQNSTKNAGLTIAHNQPFLKPGLAVRIQSKPTWLGITPTSGTIPAGNSSTVTLTGNATGLDLGTYDSNLFVVSNDGGNPTQRTLVSFNVGSNQATVHEWPTASGIVFGQSLSESTLSGGSASVEGSFAFDSPAITPNAGSYSAAVTFTPTDTASYSSVGGIVTVEVDKATPVITAWPTASAVQYGQYFSASILSGGSASVPGSFAFIDPAVMFDGQDSFTFRVSDGESTSDPAMVSITIAGQQGAPESTPLDPNASRPWTPADLTTLAWYDAADVSTITVESGAVSQWSDKSGNARHVAQATSGRRPTVSGTTIAFDGTDDFLTRSGAFCYAAGSADFYVVAAATNGNARIISENRSSADNPMYGFRISSTDSRMGAYVRADDGSELFNNTMSATNVFSRQTPNVYMWRDTGSNLSGRVAGGGSTNVGYSRSGKVMTLNQFTIGATGPRPNAPNGLTFVNAGMNEIVITANLSDADRQKMEGYLAWKWNLHGNLPGDHPYKQAAPAIITNNAPIANAQGVTVQPGTPKTITLTGSDPDNDSLVFEILTQPTHGTLSGTPPNVTYTPPAAPAVGTHDVTVTFTPTDTANYHSVTSTVSVIVNGSSSPYVEWTAQYPDHDLGDPLGDVDGDGLNNFHEFAFGLNPSNGISANPIVTPFDKASHSFSYTRRAGSGLTYTVCISTNLRDWQDLPQDEVSESVAENTETRVETVGVALLSPPSSENLYLRVRAQ